MNLALNLVVVQYLLLYALFPRESALDSWYYRPPVISRRRVSCSRGLLDSLGSDQSNRSTQAELIASLPSTDFGSEAK